MYITENAIKYYEMNQNSLNIAYSFDDGYAQHAAVSIVSLLENNKDIENIIVHIITNALNKENTQRIEEIVGRYGRKVRYHELDTLTKQMKTSTSFNRSAYGRIFLDSLTDISRIIYVDSDTVIEGSLKELMMFNMTDSLVAGVQDTVNPYYIINIGLDHTHRYINDGGVIILNLDLWREMNITSKCIDFVYSFNGNPPHNDQGTINAVCAGRIKILPPNYNVMPPMFCFTSKQIKSIFKMRAYYTQEELDNAIKKPIVIHYTDEFFNRPWFENCTHPLKDLYLKYLELTPWRGCQLPHKSLTRNCKIQNWVYNNCPFFVYKLMVRFIEVKHRLKISTKK